MTKTMMGDDAGLVLDGDVQRPTGLLLALRNAAGNAVTMVRERRRERRRIAVLAGLSDAQLRDIGVEPGDVKSSWDRIGTEPRLVALYMAGR